MTLRMSLQLKDIWQNNEPVNINKRSYNLYTETIMIMIVEALAYLVP